MRKLTKPEIRRLCRQFWADHIHYSDMPSGMPDSMASAWEDETKRVAKRLDTGLTIPPTMDFFEVARSLLNQEKKEQ